MEVKKCSLNPLYFAIDKKRPDGTFHSSLKTELQGYVIKVRFYYCDNVCRTQLRCKPIALPFQIGKIQFKRQQDLGKKLA